MNTALKSELVTSDEPGVDFAPRVWFGGVTPSSVQPVPHLAELDFWKLAVAPQRGEICEASDELMRRYSRQAPGSDAATQFLMSLAAECRARVQNSLLAAPDRDIASIEFVAGMCRGLEIALSRAKRGATILVSPYEHPAASAVVRWHASLTGAKVRQLTFAAADHYLPWAAQRDKLVELIASQIDPSEPAVLLLSAVHYATGHALPVLEVLDALAATNRSPEIVLDCAHAAANALPLPILGRCVGMVMSVHKWLLAPEPCGIVVTPRRLLSSEVPYDSWYDTTPETTANLRVFTSLVSSLRAFDRSGPQNWRAHSLALRDQFLERMRERLMPLGELSGMEMTSLIAVRPRPGLRWKYDRRELGAFLEHNSVYALVLGIDPALPWLRLSFPRNLQSRHVARLCDVLDRTLE